MARPLEQSAPRPARSIYRLPLPPGSQLLVRQRHESLRIVWRLPRRLRPAEFLLILVLLGAIFSLALLVGSLLIGAPQFNNPANGGMRLLQLASWAIVLLIGTAGGFVVSLYLVQSLKQKSLESISLTPRDLVYEKSTPRHLLDIGMIVNPFRFHISDIKSPGKTNHTFRSPRQRAAAHIYEISGRSALWLESIADDPDNSRAAEIGHSLDENDKQWLCQTIHDWAAAESAR